jgi:diaminopimelate decarboxylase
VKWTGISTNAHGHLSVGGASALGLAKEFGTPLYVVNEDRVRQRCREFLKEARCRWPNSEVAYASKAFSCKAMCALVASEGLHLDVVSAGELFTALSANFPPDRIEFHGNNKSSDELRMALKHGVGRIICDSAEEIELLSMVAQEEKKGAKILIRLNPGVDPHTHQAIKTGNHDSKFGVPIVDGQAMLLTQKIVNGAFPNIKLLGFHCHVGSQLLEPQGLPEAAVVMMRFAKDVLVNTGFCVEEMNLGGGLGIRYLESDEPMTIAEFFDALILSAKKIIEELGLPPPRLVFEPGRAIIGDAGSTLYEVGFSKTTATGKHFVAVNGGMADNPRPALYQATYHAVLAARPNDPATTTVSIVGKCCESGDILLHDIKLPEPKFGEILAVFSTGAYNYSMSSNYNRLPKPAVVFVSNGEPEVVVRRETLEDITSHDELPKRLSFKR